MYDVILKTPVGFIGIQCAKAKLLSIRFLDQHIIPFPCVKIPEKVKEIAKRIDAFFARAEPLSDLPHILQGTPFQIRVWKALCQIPLGETRTYGELGKKMATSARAIGSACRANPLPLVIPCHRVVGTKVQGGFCGKENKVSIKNWLLAHESISC